MSTIEKLIVQILGRKNSIIEQVKHQIELYDQQLASRAVIDGITPPSWLWNPGSHSQPSDLAELRREDLISEFLLPSQQPSVSYATCQNSLLNNTVFPVNKEDRQFRPLEETCNSVEGLNEPTCSHQGRIHNVECVSTSVPQPEPIITPHQERTGATMLNSFPKDDQSLARFQRSRSRQKALEIRNSAKTAVRDHSNDCKVNIVSSGGDAGIVSTSLQSNRGNELEFVKALEMGSESVDIRQENVDSSQSKERHSSIRSGRNTRSVGSSQQSNHVHKPEVSNSSSDIADDDAVILEGDATKISLQPHNHVGDSLKLASNFDIKSFSSGLTIFGQTHLKEQCSNDYSRQVTMSQNSCHSTKLNSINVSSESAFSPDILHPDGDVIQESHVQAEESSDGLSKIEGDADFSTEVAQVCAGSSGQKDLDLYVGNTRKPETEGNCADEQAGGSTRSQTPPSSQGMPEHRDSYISGCAMTLSAYADSNQYQNAQASQVPSALPPPSGADEHVGGSTRFQTPCNSQGLPEHGNFNISDSAMMQSRYAVSNQSQSANASQIPPVTTQPSNTDEYALGSTRSQTPFGSQGLLEPGNFNISGSAVTQSRYAASNQYQSAHASPSATPPSNDAAEHAGGSLRSQTPCSSQGLPDPGNSNVSGSAMTQFRYAVSNKYQSAHASPIPPAMPPPSINDIETSTVNARVCTGMENCADGCISRFTSSLTKDTTKGKAELFNSNIAVHTKSHSSAAPPQTLVDMYETEDNEVVLATDLNVSHSTDMIGIHDERCASPLEETVVPDTPVDTCMDPVVVGPKGVTFGVGLEAFASGPSSDSAMLVKPQKLDFDDSNKCRLNATRSPIEDMEEEMSLETRHSVLLEPLHVTESSHPRRASIVMEHSWPQSKRRKIEGQFTSVLSTSPTLTVKALQSNHRNAVGRNFNWDVSSSNTVLRSPYEVPRVTQTDDMSPNLESCSDVKFHILEGSNDSQKLPVKEGAHSSGGTDKSKAAFTFKLDEIVPSMFSISTKQDTGVSQCCKREEVRLSSQTSTVIDVRREFSALHNQDLLHLRNEEGDRFSCHSDGPLYNQYLDTTEPDSYLPILEGFTLETDARQSQIVAGEVSFDEENLPKSTLERASFLEQLCKSVSMHTPSAHFSSAYKLHQTPHLYQSVPNGLLENIDLKSALYLNDDTVEPSAAGPSCFKDEVNHTFHARSYSEQLTNPRSTFDIDLRNPYRSPVGRLWERTNLSKSSSSEKHRCSNPELTCFPIAEDPNICEGSTDEVPDTFQDDMRSIALNKSMHREPLAEVIEHYESSPTLVSNVLTFNGRLSPDSPSKEDSLGSKNTVKQKLENHDNKKRRCTTKAKENKSLSLTANGVEHVIESHRNRISKSKECKRNNIVSNVTSFVPLVQPKQTAPVITGKRDIKVKSLEAAEALKRLEEKKENERKMKKEALKLKKAKLEQENLKQLELKKKEKEEAQKKKVDDMAERKRAREVEEKKEKAVKRKRIEEVETRKLQREQEEKVHAGKQDVRGLRKKEVKDDKGQHKKIEQEKRYDNSGKVRETESRSIASSMDNIYKESIATVYGRETLGDSEVAKSNLGRATGNVYSPAKSSVEDSYEISPYKESDDDEEEEDVPNNKFIPSWCSKNSLGLAVSSQQQIDVDVIFPLQSFSSINEVLMPRKKLLK